MEVAQPAVPPPAPKPKTGVGLRTRSNKPNEDYTNCKHLFGAAKELDIFFYALTGKKKEQCTTAKELLAAAASKTIVLFVPVVYAEYIVSRMAHTGVYSLFINDGRATKSGYARYHLQETFVGAQEVVMALTAALVRLLLDVRKAERAALEEGAMDVDDVIGDSDEQ